MLQSYGIYVIFINFIVCVECNSVLIVMVVVKGGETSFSAVLC